MKKIQFNGIDLENDIKKALCSFIIIEILKINLQRRRQKKKTKSEIGKYALELAKQQCTSYIILPMTPQIKYEIDDCFLYFVHHIQAHDKYCSIKVIFVIQTNLYDV